MAIGSTTDLARLLPSGIRWRVTGLVAAVMLLSFAVVFVAVYRGTGRELRGQIDHDIAGYEQSFSHSLQRSGASSPQAVSKAAELYVRGQPFSAGSTLQFALVPGAATATNQPEFFTAERPDNGESAAEQAHENRLSARLRQLGDGYATLPLPDVGDLRVLKRTILLHSSNGRARLAVTLGVGEPLRPVGRAQRGVARAFVLAGALMLAVALIASFLVGTRVSRPLRRIAAVAARVDAGDLHPRIHDVGSRRDEVRVLADAFNHMLDRLTDAFAGQRAFVADASHELRTPLTVIRGQLEVLAAQPNPSGEEVRRVEGLLQREIARIGRLIDDLLLLAKAEQPELLRPEQLDLRAFVGELWDGAGVTAQRDWELAEVPEGRLRADPDRLAQALRNMLANAVSHTASPSGRIRLEVRVGELDRVRFVIEDDGPGIPEDQRALVFERFHRTDAARNRSTGGTGLGLAIVRAIAEVHGGHVTATAGPAGGARMELELPGFTAARSSPTPVVGA